MPRISAPSVQEHREAQRCALLNAARAIVVRGGAGELGFAELAERTGLARPSIYEYFRNKSALIRALIDDEFPAWHEQVARAVAAAPDGASAVSAFVESQLNLISAGRHELAFALMQGPLDPDAREHLEGKHAALLAEIRPALLAMGAPDPDFAARMVATVVASAASGLRSSTDPAPIVKASARFAVGGVRGLAESHGTAIPAHGG